MEKVLSKNTTGDKAGYILIDSPITPYSSEEDILTWINKLKAHSNRERPEVQEEITIAENILMERKNEQ